MNDLMVKVLDEEWDKKEVCINSGFLFNQRLGCDQSFGDDTSELIQVEELIFLPG